MMPNAKCIETAPEAIWLNVSDEEGDWYEEFENYPDVMWSAEQGDGPALRVGVKYQRADLCPQWISVKDRLPEIETRVLVYDRNEVIQAAELWEGRWVDGREFMELDGITHWQHLPEPPKEGEG